MVEATRHVTPPSLDPGGPPWPPPLPTFLLLPLLLAAPSAPSPVPEPCQTGVRHVELPVEPQVEAPLVCVSPGQATLLDFGEPFAPGSVALEGQEHFAWVDPARSTLKLVPSERLRPGERLRLTMRFADTAAPASATLLLLVHPALAEPLVYVHRQVREADSYRRELTAAKEETRQCREENARLREARNVPKSLVELLASGLLGDKDGGVLAADISERVERLPTSALTVSRVQTYRTEGLVAVRLRLKLPKGAAPWVAEGATLSLAGRQGEALKALDVWQPAPIAGGESGTLVVEAEAPAQALPEPLVLKVWEAGGARAVTLGGVTLP